jgi:ATP phosphoribosyltransferase
MMVPTRSRTEGSTDLLRVAVPKGALFAGCVDVLDRAGLDVEPLRDLGRQLTVIGEGVEYIIAKPTDVPIYVAYGAADVAIAGKDVLVEADLDVAELVDLGFGACRFVVARPEDRAGNVDDRYRHLGVLRVATKYPRVAEAHFERRGIQVEIVKLHGNIELAPLIGMADVIVDIVATGRTLAENGLVVVDEVFASTARFVANPVALKTDDRVADLAARCAAAGATTERT